MFITTGNTVYQKFILLLIILLAGMHPAKAQVVNTQFGQVQGMKNGSVFQFLGIPFAKPPVGALRWKFPQNPEPWNGILQTTEFSPVCPQKEFQQGDTTYILKGDEDCLYLNVWTPQTGAGHFPVLVFIHGGGNQQGGASSVSGGTQMFFGKNMAERGNAVVVTIQYRLGPLGFLVHPGLEAENAKSISGNYAAMDQILALTWIKNNISNFGGDPSKVMIFGESAGGVNVGNLLVSPLAEGLFQRACIQSATPMVNDYKDSRDKGIAFVNNFISTGSDIEKITLMRLLPADSIIKDLTSPIVGGVVQSNWQSVVDGYVFPNSPLQSLQNGMFNKVPLLLGSNSDEMSLSAPSTVYPIMVTALVNAVVPPDLRPQALQLYPPGTDQTQARQSYVGLLTDLQFTVNARRTAQCVSLKQPEPVWRYFFTHKHTIQALKLLGSYHGMELFYVFNNWENATLGSGFLFKPADDSVQKVMLSYWVNFANTGNPNAPGLAAWPQYQSVTDCYLEIKASPDGNQCGLRTEQSDLWDDVTGFAKCTTTGRVEESRMTTPFGLYPNPTHGSIAISPDRTDASYEILIFDFTGKKVLDTADKHQLDISGLPDGIYLVKFVQGRSTWQTKIVKQ